MRYLETNFPIRIFEDEKWVGSTIQKTLYYLQKKFAHITIMIMKI
jgi:hypothetical protein